MRRACAKAGDGVTKMGLFGVAPECETPGGRHRRIKCLPLGDSLSLTASPFPTVSLFGESFSPECAIRVFFLVLFSEFLCGLT